MEHMRGRRGAVALVLGWALGLAGCGDGVEPVAPPAEGPVFAQVSSGRLQVVRRRTPLVPGVEATVLVDAAGARIELAGAGVVLTVPPGAVGGNESPVAVTVRAVPGRELVLEFGPHGLRFRRPAALEVDLTGTEAEGAGPGARLWVVYFEDGGEAGYVGLETLRPQVDGNRLRVELRHFSGYLIAMG